MMKTTTLKTKAMSVLLAIVILLGMLPFSSFVVDVAYSYPNENNYRFIQITIKEAK